MTLATRLLSFIQQFCSQTAAYCHETLSSLPVSLQANLRRKPIQMMTRCFYTAQNEQQFVKVVSFWWLRWVVRGFWNCDSHPSPHFPCPCPGSVVCVSDVEAHGTTRAVVRRSTSAGDWQIEKDEPLYERLKEMLSSGQGSVMKSKRSSLSVSSTVQCF